MTSTLDSSVLRTHAVQLRSRRRQRQLRELPAANSGVACFGAASRRVSSESGSSDDSSSAQSTLLARRSKATQRGRTLAARSNPNCPSTASLEYVPNRHGVDAPTGLPVSFYDTALQPVARRPSESTSSVTAAQRSCQRRGSQEVERLSSAASAASSCVLLPLKRIQRSRPLARRASSQIVITKLKREVTKHVKDLCQLRERLGARDRELLELRHHIQALRQLTQHSGAGAANGDGTSSVLQASRPDQAQLPTPLDVDLRLALTQLRAVTEGPLPAPVNEWFRATARVWEVLQTAFSNASVPEKATRKLLQVAITRLSQDRQLVARALKELQYHQLRVLKSAVAFGGARHGTVIPASVADQLEAAKQREADLVKEVRRLNQIVSTLTAEAKQVADRLECSEAARVSSDTQALESLDRLRAHCAKLGTKLQAAKAAYKEAHQSMKLEQRRAAAAEEYVVVLELELANLKSLMQQQSVKSGNHSRKVPAASLAAAVSSSRLQTSNDAARSPVVHRTSPPRGGTPDQTHRVGDPAFGGGAGAGVSGRLPKCLSKSVELAVRCGCRPPTLRAGVPSRIFEQLSSSGRNSVETQTTSTWEPRRGTEGGSRALRSRNRSALELLAAQTGVLEPSKTRQQQLQNVFTPQPPLPERPSGGDATSPNPTPPVHYQKPSLLDSHHAAVCEGLLERMSLQQQQQLEESQRAALASQARGREAQLLVEETREQVLSEFSRLASFVQAVVNREISSQTLNLSGEFQKSSERAAEMCQRSNQRFQEAQIDQVTRKLQETLAAWTPSERPKRRSQLCVAEAVNVNACTTQPEPSSDARPLDTRYPTWEPKNHVQSTQLRTSVPLPESPEQCRRTLGSLPGPSDSAASAARGRHNAAHRESPTVSKEQQQQQLLENAKAIPESSGAGPVPNSSEWTVPEKARTSNAEGDARMFTYHLGHLSRVEPRHQHHLCEDSSKLLARAADNCHLRGGYFSGQGASQRLLHDLAEIRQLISTVFTSRTPVTSCGEDDDAGLRINRSPWEQFRCYDSSIWRATKCRDAHSLEFATPARWVDRFWNQGPEADFGAVSHCCVPNAPRCHS